MTITEVIEAYFAALRRDDLQTAYGLLSRRDRTHLSYEQFASPELTDPFEVLSWHIGEITEYRRRVFTTDGTERDEAYLADVRVEFVCKIAGGEPMTMPITLCVIHEEDGRKIYWKSDYPVAGRLYYISREGAEEELHERA